MTQLKNGKWLVKVPIGKDARGGTRYRHKTCVTKTDARSWQRQLISLREQQMLVVGPRQTLRQYAEEILLNANDHVADRTRDGYFRTLRKHVFPDLGSRVLTEVRPQELERLFSGLRRKYSASTVNNVRVALSKVYSIALRHELVLTNPVSRTKKAKRSEFEKTQVRLPWTQGEVIEALEASRGTPLEAFLTLTLATGMRLGEVLGLQWRDIHFDAQSVSIERTIHRESIIQSDGERLKGVKVSPPKTASSRRVNQLSEPVLDVLRRHQMEQDAARGGAGLKWIEFDYIFTNNQGGPLDESKVRKQYRAFLAKNGLRFIRIHDLRHTFATILIEEDSGQLASVSKALGHSSIGITMDIYAKTARVETRATSRMSEIMFPDRGKVFPIFVASPGVSTSLAPGRRRST